MKKIHKKYLSHLARQYLQLKKDFELSQQEIVSGLKLDPNKRDQVRFGIINPAEPSLQVYADKINSNTDLILMHESMKKIKLSAYKFLLSEMWVRKIKIPGSDINKMFEEPEKSSDELEALFLGLAGYEHIYIVDDKIVKELPARIYVRNHPEFLKMVDYWTKKVKEFE